MFHLVHCFSPYIFLQIIFYHLLINSKLLLSLAMTQ
jgi:hypothetical protein